MLTVAVSEFAKNVPTQMRTCPECKRQVPHRKVIITGGPD